MDQKNEIRMELGIHEEKVLLSVGRFLPGKGYDVLMKACRFLDRNTGVYIIGGDPTEEYSALKQKWDLQNVHFIGFLPKEELIRYYMAADVFVLPTRHDVWGLVINEAMAFGLPVVTTNKCVAGLELIEDGVNGYIVPVEDECLLAERISKILSDENLRGSMSQASLDRIRQYTIENMSERHLAIFEQIMGQQNGLEKWRK